MAFFDDWRKKYEEKIKKPIGEKFAGTPLGSFEALKEYLGGIAGKAQEVLKTPKQMQAERHEEAFRKMREEKMPTPGMAPPTPGMAPDKIAPSSLMGGFSALKEALTPTPSMPGESASERMVKAREEWAKKWGDMTTGWLKERGKEIVSPWMKETEKPTPSIDYLKGVPGKVAGWHKEQIAGLPGLKEKLGEGLEHFAGGPGRDWERLKGRLSGVEKRQPDIFGEDFKKQLLERELAKREGEGLAEGAPETGVLEPTKKEDWGPIPFAPEDTALGEGLKEMGVGAPGAPGAVDTGKLLIGVTDETTKFTIQERIDKINRQIDTLRWQLDMKPGLTLEQKTAYEGMAKEWAEAGASADDIARMIDNLTRADADKLSSKIIPTYDKYLKTPEVTKAKDMLEGLYTKYTGKEGDLNDKIAEANEAINAIKQSPYLTQSMIVGRTDRMRDEYNMEINSIRNDLNTLGKDIDRGRGALKTLMDEGFKMAGVEIGALGMGIEEDIMKRMPFGYESILSYLRGQPGQPPATIGPGRFGWTGKGYEQVTPFAPEATPSAKAEKQTVTEEHKYYLEGLMGEGGFVNLEDFMAMMEDWMYRSGSYNPQQYVSMFARRFLSPDDRSNLPMELLGMGG